MARPIKYDESYIKAVNDYVESCEDMVTDVITGQSEKFTTYKQKITVKLPTIEGLARILKVHKDTIYDWEKKYPEFSDVIGDLRAKQAEKLINSGLCGDYNPTIAKVLLSKHGYRDATEIEHSGDIEVKNYRVVSARNRTRDTGK